jgi:methylmalonyl-CoA epimerase
MTNKITHFGIVVNDADAACDLWCASFGMKKAGDMLIAEEGIRSVFISVDGTRDGMSIELMEPTDKADMDNAVARRLAQKGEGFYHVCLEVESVADSAKILEARKMRVIHRDAVGGGDVGRWLVHPKDANGVMVEGIGGLGNNPAR